jgi:hypothetical protein
MSDLLVIQPAFVRLPRSGTRCPLTGLSRGVMQTLVLPSDANKLTPPVRSRILRQKGKNRGVRLVEVDSLLKYLNGLPSDGGDS